MSRNVELKESLYFGKSFGFQIFTFQSCRSNLFSFFGGVSTRNIKEVFLTTLFPSNLVLQGEF